MRTVRLGVLIGLSLCTIACAPKRQTGRDGTSGLDPVLARELVARHSADSIQAVIATLGLIKATDPDVRRLAQTLLNDHLQTMTEIRMLVAELGSSLPTVSNDSLKPIVARFTKMIPGAAFDAAFLEQVVLAHRQDQQGRRRLASSVNATLRQFLDRTWPTFERHLRLTEALRSSRR
jgi:predicted outer membrane protein